MNTKFLITTAVALVAAISFAQRPGGAGGPGAPGRPGQPGGPGMRRGMDPALAKQLNLTAAQKKKLDAINAKMRAEFMKLSEADRRTKGREIFMKFRKEREAVFTAKQKEVMKKWRDAHPRPGGFGGRPGAPGAQGRGGKPGTGGKTGKAGGGKSGI